VANIPYQISSPLVFKLLSHRPLFRAAVIMFQTEFAMRLVARPGDSTYTRLSVNTQLLARVTHLMKVGRNNFRPPPKVDSSVVRIEPRSPVPDVNFKEWDGLLRLCFGRKNKTLGGIFRQKSTLELLETNYRTWKALQLGSERPAAAGGDVVMGEVAAAGESEAFKERVISVLESNSLDGARSSKLTQDDFLRLLALFNAAGIHFA
jgi:18S rRNA (adenine1779-N6/adenine1780-N6)-dimethyltransferase